MQVFCDFDGTISLSDTTDVILSRFARPEWELIEEEWKRGAIGSAECMAQQIALIEASPEALDEALDSLDIDPAFPAFIRYCQWLNAPVTIISDGIDYFIRRILKRYHLSHLPIIANHLQRTPEGAWRMATPYSAAGCTAAAGVCKCAKVADSTFSVFIGDGRSDFCASNKVDLLFAKSTLATYCEQQGIDYTAYHSFADIQRALPHLLPMPHEHYAKAEAHAVA